MARPKHRLRRGLEPALGPARLGRAAQRSASSPRKRTEWRCCNAGQWDSPWRLERAWRPRAPGPAPPGRAVLGRGGRAATADRPAGIAGPARTNAKPILPVCCQCAASNRANSARRLSAQLGLGRAQRGVRLCWLCCNAGRRGSGQAVARLRPAEPVRPLLPPPRTGCRQRPRRAAVRISQKLVVPPTRLLTSPQFRNIFTRFLEVAAAEGKKKQQTG